MTVTTASACSVPRDSLPEARFCGCSTPRVVGLPPAALTDHSPPSRPPCPQGCDASESIFTSSDAGLHRHRRLAVPLRQDFLVSLSSWGGERAGLDESTCTSVWLVFGRQIRTCSSPPTSTVTHSPKTTSQARFLKVEPPVGGLLPK